MKITKTLCIVLGILLAASFTSCQKENNKAGVYAPKKKIQQVYYSADHLDKTPFEHLEWNGDKLNSITHYMDMGFKSDNWVEFFTYDDNRLTRVDNYTNSEYITYEYDGNHLKSATVFYRNAIACTWAISYEENHINKMVGTFYEYYYKDDATPHLNPLSHVLPQNIYQKVEKHQRQMEEQRHQKGNYTLVLLLSWTDDNISKLIITGDGEYAEIQMQYDDKNCPWYGFMGGLEDYLVNYTSGHTGFTKHNITSMVVTEGQYVDTVCFAYQYDSDKYPVLQTMYYLDDPDDKDILYFEY